MMKSMIAGLFSDNTVTVHIAASDCVASSSSAVVAAAVVVVGSSVPDMPGELPLL